MYVQVNTTYGKWILGVQGQFLCCPQQKRYIMLTSSCTYSYISYFFYAFQPTPQTLCFSNLTLNCLLPAGSRSTHGTTLNLMYFKHIYALFIIPSYHTTAGSYTWVNKVQLYIPHQYIMCIYNYRKELLHFNVLWKRNGVKL